MPRCARIEIAGGIHHVTAKSPSGRLLFLSDPERQVYLSLLGHEVQERGWSLLTYCLMTNHLHLVVRTPEPDLGRGMKTIQERFAGFINRTRGEGGHLFGARFHNKPVLTQEHLLACFRYIARNPVEAQICAGPDEYPWSAHPALAGLTPAPRFLDLAGALREFGGPELAASRRNYERFVSRSDLRVLEDIVTPGDDRWIATARDLYDIPLEMIITFSGLSRRTVYRRLAEARDIRGTEGTVP